MINMGLKRLQQGFQTPQDLELLRSLKASDFVGDGVLAISKDMRNVDVLHKWNTLQKSPTKRRNFTFMEVGRAGKIANYLTTNYPISGFPKYAFIKHDKDNTQHVHYHFYLEFQNPRSFSSVANELNIPVTNLQGVLSKSGILQYLTHENDPKKFHYDKSDITSNFGIEEELVEKAINPYEEFNDYWAMKKGIMSKKEFFEKYKADIIRHSSFATRISMYSKMESVS